MSDEHSFTHLMERVRTGDHDAAAELVRTYEPAIRAAVRGRMSDDRLRRLFDSSDVCQTVLATFFARVCLGQYELKSADDLVRLLVTIAKNKLSKKIVLNQRSRRDYRRTAAAADVSTKVDEHQEDPAEQFSNAELIEKMLAEFTPAERDLIERRRRRDDWATIGSALGTTAEAARKQHARAIARVTELYDDELEQK